MSEVTHGKDLQEKNIVVSYTAKLFLFFTLITVVLFTLLFTTYPPVHDFFHGVRHALMIIPCH